jgi:hypothetical protein
MALVVQLGCANIIQIMDDIQLIKWKLKGNPSLKDLALIFLGFFVGWLTATIKFIQISKN